MKFLLLIVFLYISSSFSLAQNHKGEVCFDRNWLFARFGLQADGTKLQEPDSLESINFNDTEWRKLDLPHDWGIEGPFREELEGYTGKLPWKGIGWYRKHFFIDKKEKDFRFYVDFDGAMANAEVWLNGHKIGERPYGYISFRVDLTPFINWGGNNVIAVRLDTEKLGSRWYPGAGIYRHVRLVKASPIHVAHWGVFVKTPQIEKNKAMVCVDVSIQNNYQEDKNGRILVEIYKLDEKDRLGEKVASNKKDGILVPSSGIYTDSVLLEVVNPLLWNVNEPHRYLARVIVFEGKEIKDVYDTSFGIRKIEFTHHNGFLLNNKRVQLKGVCLHHDLGALGTAVHRSALKRQLNILKGFGCNAIRTSHNPPAPELLDLADKMGFLVIDEVFDCWEHSKKENDYGSLFKQWHKKDVESHVCRDRNHPSIILWSTGNEVQEQYNPESGMARYLTELVHRFDKTRPVTFGASYPSKSAMNGTELQVDVHGMNYAAGCYGGPHFYGEFLDKKGHEHLSGYSSESSSTMSSRGEYFPRKFHVSSYDLNEPGWGGLPDWEFAALERYPAICGEFVWTGFDYLGEPTPYNTDSSILLNHAAALDKDQMQIHEKNLEKINEQRPTSRSSYFGIVDLAGFPKDRYYLYQAHWCPDLPMAHILPHWNFPERVGMITPVFVYTSGDEAELFLNGKSLGKRKKSLYEYRLKWENVIYEPGELKVVAYKRGKKWAEDKVKTTGKAVRLKLTPDKACIVSDGDDLVFVRVSFVDAEGNEVPTAENVVSCKIEGPGKVIATDNGDPTCLIDFNKTIRPAFNGLLLAIIKADRDSAGELLLRVEAEGVETQYLKLKVVR